MARHPTSFTSFLLASTMHRTRQVSIHTSIDSEVCSSECLTSRLLSRTDSGEFSCWASQATACQARRILVSATEPGRARPWREHMATESCSCSPAGGGRPEPSRATETCSSCCEQCEFWRNTIWQINYYKMDESQVKRGLRSPSE